MACFHQLPAWRSRSLTGERRFGITFQKSEAWTDLPMNLPCGKCIGCRIQRAQEWGTRVMNELKAAGPSAFVTLTYDDEHLPPGGTLVPNDLKLFWLRLRRKHDKPFRYFACGEYGDKTNRPHYHAVVFGYWPQHRVRIPGERNTPMYRSDELDRLWPHGQARLSPVTRENAVYIAKYTLGKYDEQGQPRDFGQRRAPYLTMSTHPGIGHYYAREHARALARFGGVRQRGGTLAAVPRYYVKVLARHEPNLADGLKRRRIEKMQLNTESERDNPGPLPGAREENALARVALAERKL